MKLLLVLVSIFALSCGSDKKIEETPAGCDLTQVEGGVEWECINSKGEKTNGVVKNGEPGSKGEPGAKGEKGEGQVVVKEVQCKGLIEGWMPESGYEIEVGVYSFETGAVFMSSSNKLLRGSEVINHRSASSFYVTPSADLEIGDGLFEMKLSGMELLVSSKGGASAKLPCLEK